MPDTPNPQLLRSLGKLARGLSALFWGLPVALLTCVETARAELLKPLGFLPALAVTALLVYGIWQLGDFQRQERPWRAALDRAQIFALIILGLCPFIYFHNKVPGDHFFAYTVNLLELAAVLFLFNLNLVLRRLGAMLPDETLRSETRQFTALNRWLLVVSGVWALLIGILLVVFPGGGILALLWLVGIFLIVLGLFNIVTGIRMRSAPMPTVTR